MGSDEQIGPDAEILAERWLSEHGDYLYRFARSRLSDATLSEDLVQETILTGMRKHMSFRGESSERNWLTGILRFKLLEVHRRQARETKIFEPQASGQTDTADWFDEDGHWNRATLSAAMEWDPDPSLILDRKEFWETLRGCLEKLPDRVSAVFVQRELEFREADEITDDLGITSSNLWVMLHRARNQLRRCIQSFWKSGS